jgi:hypothetical protein
MRERIDYNVAVFLKDLTDRWPEMNRLADLSADILDETRRVHPRHAYRAGSSDDRTPLVHEICTGGVDL